MRVNIKRVKRQLGALMRRAKPHHIFNESVGQRYKNCFYVYGNVAGVSVSIPWDKSPGRGVFYCSNEDGRQTFEVMFDGDPEGELTFGDIVNGVAKRIATQ